MLQSTIIFVMIIILLMLLYDYFQSFSDWFGRIKIGVFSSDDEWIASVKKIILKWLKKGTPALSVSENKRFKIAEKISNLGKVASTAYWQDAAIIKATNSEDCSDFVESMLSRYISNDTGEWLINPARIDCAMLAYELMCNKNVDNKKIEPAMKYVADLIIELSSDSGTCPYNANAKKYRFVDTVGMICPFLINYTTECGDGKYVDLAIAQIKEYKKYGISKDYNIPFHSFNTETKAPLGLCGWGRGCAWWALGLTDSLKSLLNTENFEKEKIFLLKTTVGFLDEMLKYQSPCGAFNRMIFNDSSEDSSATSMLAYCYSEMYKLTKKEEYAVAAKNALVYLKSRTRRNGIVDFSQGDTGGIGYYSSSVCVVPAAQGFTYAAYDNVTEKRENKL